MDDIDPQLLAVQGYLELGMLEDARAELGAVQGAAREGVDFAVLQIEVLMLAKCWSHARDACQKFSQRWPDNSHGFLHEGAGEQFAQFVFGLFEVAKGGRAGGRVLIGDDKNQFRAADAEAPNESGDAGAGA